MRAALLRNAHRVVVKLGTGILTDGRKRPDQVQFAQLVAQISGLRADGRQVVLVSSGAVGAGMGALGFHTRPRDLADLQACAAVGQSRLMAMYEALFRHYELQVAQVLLTHDDLADHARHLNARNTLLALLRRGVVPIINENDAVSVTELKFGDNDRLSALVASLLPADLLVVLTSEEGLLADFGGPVPQRLSEVPEIDPSVEQMAGGTRSTTSVGGMLTKIQAAKILVRVGVPMVIASGRRFDALQRILEGADVGTLFIPRAGRLPARKRWIAFYHRPAGTLLVDAGAGRALREMGGSLLYPGISDVDGTFGAGAVVRVVDAHGREIARGLTRWSSAQLDARSGTGEVIHRNDLVVL